MAGRTMTKPRGDKTQRYVFYLGLLLAGIAAIIVFVAVNSAGSDGGSGEVPVVMANQAIPADTRVTPDMLTVEYFATDEAAVGAFSSRSQVLDRVVTEDVAEGAAVLPTMVSDVAGDSLAFKVEPGMRAISVEVQEVVTAGGNVKPGDHVDMIAIFEVTDAEAANDILQILGLNYTVVEPPKPAPTTNAQGEEENVDDGRMVLTVTMLQDVKLLALAQSLTETTVGSNVADDTAEVDSEPRAATATVELTPQQAQETTWADHFGILRFGARPVGDEEVVEVVPTLLRIENTR